jgi:3-hydroxyisobutyrate dehydrogenase
MTIQNVAVLGLGIMGGGIAANILKNGFAVKVWNRSPGKAEPLISAGATHAASPAEAAKDADLVLACVGDDAASQSVWLGETGAFGAMKPGSVAVECSTLSHTWTADWHTAAQAAGVAAVDAPLAGSKLAAAGGQLSLFVGGTAEAFERALPVLKGFSAAQTHFGGPGAGAQYKLINNLLAATQLAALVEGLNIAQAAGLNLGAMAQAVQGNSAFGSPIVKLKLPNMLAHAHTDVHFALKWMRKDVTYALALARALGIQTAVNDGTLKQLERAVAAGFGDADLSAIIEG